MSDKDIKKKIVEQATNDVLIDKFVQDVGHKARVDRMDAQGESIDQLRVCLADLGDELSRRKIAPAGMKYIGSLSVHVYYSEILQQAAFVNLNNMKELPFGVADAACREMNNKVKEYHGMKRQKLRSGF